MIDPNSLEQRGRLTASRCERLALRISQEATKIQRSNQTLRIINIVVGAAAALVTVSAPVAVLIGANGTQAIFVIAACVLILDGLVPYFSHKPSPDRLRDYAFFIREYAGSIGNALADTGLTDAQRSSRLLAHLELAEKNLSDVCRNFEHLYHDAITKHEGSQPQLPNATGNA